MNWVTRFTQKRNFWFLINLLGFGAVYTSSLTFVYIEGGDAISILFHLLSKEPIV
jgi:hypothetical protein